MKHMKLQSTQITSRLKNRFLIFLITLVAIPFLSFGQGMAKNMGSKKVSYSFITEHGMSLGGDIAGYTGVFVNSICINRTQDIVGIGVGVEYGIVSLLCIPIFANYRHYFPSNRNLKPLINIAIGSRLTSPYRANDSWKPGFYGVIASGFRVKAFSFTSGIYLKSLDDFVVSGFEIKLGYILLNNKKTNR